ncbi:MAG: hypothetical protein IT435_06650 [Phycisphaerales bacterium]|nr:hypothetical protein [Phycisphaerales bacterium]
MNHPDPNLSLHAASPEPPLSDHELAEEMARESPDGRPAEPVLRKKGMYAMMIAFLLVVVAASAGIALLFTRDAALAGAVAAFVLLGGILTSPALISGVLRAKERDLAEKAHRTHTGPDDQRVHPTPR